MLETQVSFRKMPLYSFYRYRFYLYSRLSGILVGSTIMNGLLLKAGVNKKVAFWVTLYGFGLVSYLILKLTSSSEESTESVSVNSVTRGGTLYVSPSWKNASNVKQNSCTTVDRVDWGTLLEEDNCTFTPRNFGRRNWERHNGATKNEVSSY